MSQNPYSQFGSPGTQQYGGDFIDPTPSRTSVMAIIGLVVSIVGCIGCIIPGPGAFAAILGGLGVFFIARSSGRLTGMGLAITAIVLGLFQSVAWIALFTGFQQMNTQAGKQFFAPVGQMMSAIEKGDTAGARVLLTKEANAAITDEMIKDFAKQYRASTGAFQKTPESVWETITMSIELGKSAKSQKGTRGGRGPMIQPRGGEPQIPIPARFAQGSAFVMVVMDPVAMGQTGQKNSLINVAVMTLDGKEIWLLDPAKAGKLLRTMPGDGSDGSTPDGSGDGTKAPDKPVTPVAPDAPKPGN